MIAKELVGHPDSQLLEDYAKGVGGSEVLEQVRGRHLGDEDWVSAVRWAEETRDRHRFGWLYGVMVPGANGALKKAPESLQENSNQPKAGGFKKRIGGTAPKAAPKAGSM